VSKDNHGQTPAAWTGTFVIIGASVISTVGLVQDNWTMFWAGIVITVIGGIVWIVWEKASSRRK
jgi:cytochrome c biogenesis protein CcdA